MVRWEPDSRARLEQAALDLFSEHGYDQTTVAEIAERAGLTERTFFRHYADKREVLFGGGTVFRDRVLDAAAGAPVGMAPIDAAAAGIYAAADLLRERHEFARRRARIIAANEELRERELLKLASVSTGLADTLRGRGVDEPAASLIAEMALAAFRIAFERWVDEANRRDLAELVGEALDELRVLTA